MIFLILSLGLILRLISLNQSLWLDEATSALAARLPIADLFAKFMPGDFHPPLYYLILHYWTAFFGGSEIALRIPSVIAGILTIYVVYLIGRELSNQKTGLMGALLLATSGLHIYYSQEARMYSLAALFVALSVYFFTKILHRDRVGDFAWFGLFLSLSFLTDYLPVLIIPVFWLGGAVSKKNFNWWKKFIASHIILLISALLWGPTLLKQINLGYSLQNVSPAWWQILGLTSFKNIALIPTKFILGRISFDDKFFYESIVILLCVLFGYLLLGAKKSQRLIRIWLVLPVVLGILIGFKLPVLYYFRFLFVLPAFYILIASGISALGKYKNWVLCLILGINLTASFYYLLTPRFHREDWRAAAAAVGSSKIVFPSDSQKEALIYYGKGGQIINFSRLDGNDTEIWLSRYVWEIFDPADTARIRIESLGYNKTSTHNFNGVIFIKYESRN
jgi:mannosyltransferase